MNVPLAIATIVSSTAAVVALILVWLQLKVQSRQARQAALSALHEELVSLPMQRAIRALYRYEPTDLATPGTEEVLETIEFVVNRFNFIGYRVETGVVPANDVLRTEWQAVIRLSHQLQPFMEAEAARRNGAPYSTSFQSLVTRARQYGEAHHPQVRVEPFRRHFDADPAAV
ncbi:DUF4760 domain-containing protein [Streptodolium elevatio]|uniref:Uncharacterized protein n=1 Tax=Streptodolium elevatio TaxID=3157996 RepID=A0ABV3DW34_9ACTN